MRLVRAMSDRFRSNIVIISEIKYDISTEKNVYEQAIHRFFYISNVHFYPFKLTLD